MPKTKLGHGAFGGDRTARTGLNDPATLRLPVLRVFLRPHGQLGSLWLLFAF